jgi:hypothetical protein
MSRKIDSRLLQDLPELTRFVTLRRIRRSRIEDMRTDLLVGPAGLRLASLTGRGFAHPYSRSSRCACSDSTRPSASKELSSHSRRRVRNYGGSYEDRFTLTLGDTGHPNARHPDAGAASGAPAAAALGGDACGA